MNNTARWTPRTSDTFSISIPALIRSQQESEKHQQATTQEPDARLEKGLKQKSLTGGLRFSKA